MISKMMASVSRSANATPLIQKLSGANMSYTMKRNLKIAGIVVACFLVVLLALPFLINVDRFRPKVESEASTALGRQVTVGNLSLSTSVQVMRRMKALVNQLIFLLPMERRPALRYWRERLQSTVERTYSDAQDKLEASDEDLQGLGSSPRKISTG